MNRAMMKALLCGLAVGLFLYYALVPVGWMFYEASFLLGIDALYTGYQLFRGGVYLLNQAALFTPLCLSVGVLVTLLVYWRSSPKDKTSIEREKL